jgi:hypothetical protein
MNGLLLISFAAHAYVALRLVPGVLAAAGLPWALAMGALLAASAMLVPLWLRLTRGQRSAAARRRADRMAWVSLLLMGLFSSMFVLTVLRDVVLLVLAVVEALAGPLVPPGWIVASAAGVPVAALAITLVGLANAPRG